MTVIKDDMIATNTEIRRMSDAETDAITPFSMDCARVYDTATGSKARRVFSCYRSPGLHALAAYRLGQWCQNLPWAVRWCVELLYHYLSYRARVKWDIDISRSAKIGPGLLILHSGGIVVGPVRIGCACTISHGVTLGGAGHGDGYGLPTVGNQVFVAPGAKVFGKITIGDRVKIGANAVVHRDIQADAVVALAPGFTVLVSKE